MFRLSDASGAIKCTKECDADDVEGKYLFARADLDPKDAFIVDTGFHVWVWVGKEASRREKASSFGYASTYLKDNNRPQMLPVTVIHPKSQSERFEKYLYDRPEPSC